MKVLLHIGQSKTGTSAIQAFLTLNRKALHDNGILYPSVKVAGMTIDLGAHNAVADSLLGHSRFPYLTDDQYFEHFFEEARNANAQLLILSAEHFFAGEPRVWDVDSKEEHYDIYRRKIERLAKFLDGHEVSVLLYLRPQIDWLASAVGQTVRISGLISTKKVYENDEQFFELIQPLLDYSKLIKVWEEIIKPDSFTIIPYDRKTLHKNSSIADFLLRAKLDGIYFPFAGDDIQVNESFTREYLEVKKILNQQPHSKNTERVMIRCLERLSSESQETTQYSLPLEVERKAELFAASVNEYLNSKYAQHGMQFRAKSEKQSLRPPPLSQADIDQALDAFHKEFGSVRTRLLSLNFATRTFLRENVKPVHGALHSLKMAYLRMKYRNH